MKGGREQSKLAEFWGKHSIRYRWLPTWPPFPVRLAPDNPGPTPADVPLWVNEIAERVWEILLPLKKGMSLDYYEAAMVGYWYSAAQREITHRLEKCKSLPADSIGRQVEEEMVRQLEPVINECRQYAERVKAESPDMAEGFRYGVEKQERETGYIPSSRNSEAEKLVTKTVQIYEALWRHRRTVDLWTKERKTSQQMGEWIANMAQIQNGASHAKTYFWRNKNSDGKETYLKGFQTLCDRIGIPLPPRGRPPT